MRVSKDHAWVRMEGETAVVGVTPHAQDSLGVIQYVELPRIGKTLAAGDSLAIIESNKAASEVPAPVAGTVASVNSALKRDPGLINRDPLGKGWIAVLSGVVATECQLLLDESAYLDLVGGR